MEEGFVVVESGRAMLLDERLPARVAEDMRRRLRRMPGAAERVATCGASLGRRFTVIELADASGLSVPELLVPISELAEADILVESGERLAFRHDLIRDAVRASVSPAVRRALDRHKGRRSCSVAEHSRSRLRHSWLAARSPETRSL